MKKAVNVFIATLTAFVFLFMTISYALETTDTNEEESFFEVASEEVSTSDTLEMVLNLSLVNSSSFVFTLSSSIDISTIYTDEESGIEILTEESDGQYTLTIEITDSSSLTSSEIVLYYDLLNSVTAGTTITLTATVTDLADEENTDSTQTTITVTDTEESNSEEDENANGSNENFEQSSEFESSFENNSNSTESDMINSMSNSAQTDDLTQSVQSTTTESISISGSALSSAEEVTYNGSSNNYLSELSIDGYSLNKDFDKESSTYFAEVEDVDSVTISATAEDSEATVCIYGAESIEDGTNKIIISVTAENGSVRYYRIYISK